MPTQDTGRIRIVNRPQATNRLGKREGVYLNVFTLRLGEFSWIVGLQVAATMIAASGEARSKGSELANLPRQSQPHLEDLLVTIHLSIGSC